MAVYTDSDKGNGVLSSMRETTPTTETPQSTSSSSSMSPAVASLAGYIAGRITGSSEAATVASGLAGGKAPEDIAKGVAMGAAKREGIKALTKSGISPALAAPAIGYGVSTAVNIGKELGAYNPNMGYAMMKSAPGAAGAALGGMVLGAPGALIGGILGAMLGASSLESGVLGDLVDARSHEDMLDELEDMGYSRTESASIRDTEADVRDQYDPTGRDHYGQKHSSSSPATMSEATMNTVGAQMDAQAAENEAQGGADMGDFGAEEAEAEGGEIW